MSETSKPLGRLQRVDVRETWQTEAGDFTPWLADEANISLLGETIGLELEVEAQEKSVGPFRADILCKDTASQTWVLIENQLEKTDHTHLGQLITYAAGLEVATIVWVATHIRNEHRAALDWLNEHTAEQFSFFGLEVELWRIGESAIAPKFNVVCQPNDWTRSVSSAAKGTSDAGLSETQQLQLEYWSDLRDLMISADGAVRPTKAHPQGFIDFSLGKSGIWISAVVRMRDKGISVLLTIGTSESLAYFKLLEANRDEFDAKFGEALEWMERPGNKQKHVRISLHDADPQDRNDWPRQHAWIHDKVEKFHATFSAAAKALDSSEYIPDNDGTAA